MCGSGVATDVVEELVVQDLSGPVVGNHLCVDWPFCWVISGHHLLSVDESVDQVLHVQVRHQVEPRQFLPRFS